MNKFVNFSKILLVIIILGVSVALMYINVFSEKTKADPQILNNENPNNQSETAGWQTYEDKVKGFFIKYPSDWKYQKWSCNIDNVAFCPNSTTPGQMGSCGADCSPLSSVPIYITTEGSVTSSSIYLGDQQYKEIYNKMVSSFEKSDETASWKTHTNSQYGFSVGYPQDWTISNPVDNEVLIYCDYGCNIATGECRICQGLEGLAIGAPGPGINIFVRNIGLSDYIKEYNQASKPLTMGIVKQEDYILAGVGGVKMTGATAMGVDVNIIFASRNGKSYIISYTPLKNVQDQIISTFKFIK